MGFDTDFWEQSDYAYRTYVDAPLTDGVLAQIEKELGYKLPAAYVEMSRRQNGGIPVNRNYRMSEPTSWAPDHIAIEAIFSIGKTKHGSLCGEGGIKLAETWGYPPIGVYFADTPSAGHEMICLDYRECGPLGEPTVVHVDQECDYKITLVARSFDEFVNGLEPDEAFA